MSQRKVGNRVNGMRNKSRGITRLRALNSPMRASARPDTTSHLGSSFMMPAGTEKNKMMRAQPLVRVRRAKQPDAAAIALLIRQSFREHEPAYTPEAFDLATPRKHEIEKRINKWAVWVAIHRNEIVGTISAHSEGSALQIRSMAVHPSMRGQGIEKFLLTRDEDFASANGYKRLLLDTTPFMHSAIRLYEAFGFGFNWNRTELVWNPAQNYDETISSRSLIRAVISALLRCGEN
jgi:putative acetyltransferase